MNDELHHVNELCVCVFSHLVVHTKAGWLTEWIQKPVRIRVVGRWASAKLKFNVVPHTTLLGPILLHPTIYVIWCQHLNKRYRMHTCLRARSHQISRSYNFFSPRWNIHVNISRSKPTDQKTYSHSRHFLSSSVLSFSVSLPFSLLFIIIFSLCVSCVVSRCCCCSCWVHVNRDMMSVLHHNCMETDSQIEMKWNCKHTTRHEIERVSGTHTQKTRVLFIETYMMSTENIQLTLFIHTIATCRFSFLQPLFASEAR